MALDVYGVGNTLLDIQVKVSDDVLAKLGYDKGIMTLVDDDAQKSVLEGLAGHDMNICAGGSAANTIIGVAGFGGSTGYAGKVGNDANGESLKSDLNQLGVEFRVPATDGGQTGTCVVLITDDAQRTMLTNLAVSATLSPDDICEDSIRQAQCIYIEGYLFSVDAPREAAFRAIELAKAHNVKVAFTVSDPFLINLFKDQFWELIKGPVDLLFCNEEEAKSLADNDDPVECAKQIHSHVENVAMTLGADGSVIMDQGEALKIAGVPTQAVDTTGAGDMYAAGILYGITNSLTWRQAGNLASHASSRVVSQLGARLQQQFTADEIAQIVQN
ncbi:MAG: adenosine kinase [Planctomycetaceae bacterium]|nr:adenosine kinase [Planctomycetaceae bacterium]